MIAPIDPFEPAFRADPYRVYAQLREHDPLHRSARGSWIATRHADVAALLADPRMSHWRLPAPASNGSVFGSIVSRWIGLMDPANRSRLRRATARLFAPARIAALRSDVEAHAEALADRAAESGAIDIVSGYAEPLTLAATATQLGIAPELRTTFASVAARIRGSLFSLLITGTVPPAGEEAAHALIAMLEDAIARATTNGDDLMSALFAAEDDDRLEREEFVALALVFLFAGHENTANFITSAVWALLSSGATWNGNDAAIDELLRFESPVQFVSLTAREPIEMHGRTIAAGDEVLAGIGAANRDPALFADPERLLLDRDPNPHLALGHGPFFCIGASLARVEAQVALDVLLRRFDSLRFTQHEVRWRMVPPVLRGIESLPLAVEALAEAR